MISGVPTEHQADRQTFAIQTVSSHDTSRSRDPTPIGDGRTGTFDVRLAYLSNLIGDDRHSHAPSMLQLASMAL